MTIDLDKFKQIRKTKCYVFIEYEDWEFKIYKKHKDLETRIFELFKMFYFIILPEDKRQESLEAAKYMVNTLLTYEEFKYMCSVVR